jgi:hypothetical protein
MPRQFEECAEHQGAGDDARAATGHGGVFDLSDNRLMAPGLDNLQNES